jgi:glycosyltransferase involved in cell wall biosynthesis
VGRLVSDAAQARVPGRLGVVQRVLTRYRVPVFDTLAGRCEGGLSVLAGRQDAGEMLNVADRLDVADLVRARNLRLAAGPLAAYWQHGLMDWLTGWDPDVLVVEANPRLLSTRAAIRWMRRRDRPVIGWGWGLITQRSELARLRAWHRGRFVRRFDGMLAYSRHAARQYAEAGVPGERVHVCPNAVGFRPTTAPPQRPDAFAGPPVVLSVGRLVDAKRLDDLLRACGALEAQAPALAPEVRIVGDGPARARLEALAAAVHPRTVFLGARYGEELAREFRRADVFALPGQAGLAVQEALGHGLPVIAGEGDHTQDDLVGERNGWHVPGAGADRLAAVLREALSDVPRLRAMGAASYEVALHEANIETMVDAFARAVSELARVRA